MSNCWMCKGWGTIHPIDTGKVWNDGTPIVTWAVSDGVYYPGSVNCPACDGNGKVEPQAAAQVKRKQIAIKSQLS